MVTDDGVLDPYALFGLNEHSANLAQARRAYYELALETHPDRAPAAERRAAADQFGALHAAWKWVEEQLRGVPDAGEVVARFEDQRRAWAEFAAEGAAAAGPLPLLRFCPTGGIDATNAADYLALPNVACVGGTWLTPADAVAARDWARIRELARQAGRLQRPGLLADTP